MAKITDEQLRAAAGAAIAYELDWNKILRTPATTVYHCGGSAWVIRADGREVKITTSVSQVKS